MFLYLAVGVSVGVPLLLIIIVLMCLLQRKRRRDNDDDDESLKSVDEAPDSFAPTPDSLEYQPPVIEPNAGNRDNLQNLDYSDRASLTFSDTSHVYQFVEEEERSNDNQNASISIKEEFEMNTYTHEIPLPSRSHQPDNSSLEDRNTESLV